VIKEAKRRGYEWVLIVEDDCTPTAGFKDRWPALRNDLWTTRDKWDVFLGGPTQVHGPAQHLTNDILLIGHGYALHFYVICARNYDTALQWNADRHGPIDVYFRDVFNIATVNPLVAIQRPSPSDIRGIDVDYSDIFSDSEHSLERLSYGERTRIGTVVLLFASIGLIAYIWKRSK
jgi:hypothetical protein